MSDGGQGKKAVKAGISYTIGNIFCKGLSFVSAFIFARLMVPADYGIYNTFSSYVSILAVVIGFALHSSIKNARFDYAGRVEEYCASVTLLTLANTVFLLALVVVFKNRLAELLSIPAAMVVLVVLESFATAMLQFYNDYLAINFLSRKYLAVSLFYTVSGMVLSVFLVTTVFSSQRYLGRAFGTAIPLILISVYILFTLYGKARPKANREYWKYGLKISLPIVPHGLSQLLLSQFDRIMIKKSIGDAEAGLYSFANNIGFIYQIITNSIDTAWCPWFFGKMEEKDYATIRKSANIYMAAVSLMACGLFLISPELILIMGGSDYSESRFVVIPIVLSTYFAFIYTLPSAVEYYYKKTKQIAVGTMAAAALNIVLNSLFIPKYGYIAAAYTTVFCYVCYYIFHTVISYKIHGEFIYNMRVFAALIIGTTAFAFFCLWAVDRIALRMAILAAGLIAAAVVGFIKRKTVFEVLKKLK